MYECSGLYKDYPFNENVCACTTLSIDSTSCVDKCPSHQTEIDGKCYCANGYTRADNPAECRCAGYLIDNDERCVSECPAHQEAVNGRCQCANGYTSSDDPMKCQCTGYLANNGE